VHQLAEHEIICQVIGNCLKAPHGLEVCLGGGDGCSQSEGDAFDQPRHQDTRGKFSGNADCLDLRGQVGGLPRSIEAGDQAGPFRGQFRHNGGEIVSIDPNIAVHQDQHLMAGLAEHVLEVVHLGIVADGPAIDDQGDLVFREISHEPVDHGNGRVVGVVHSEDELIFGVVLAAEGNIIVIGLKILAGERDQNGYRRQPGGAVGGGPGKEPASGHEPGKIEAD